MPRGPGQQGHAAHAGHGHGQDEPVPQGLVREQGDEDPQRDDDQGDAPQRPADPRVGAPRDREGVLDVLEVLPEAPLLLRVGALR